MFLTGFSAYFILRFILTKSKELNQILRTLRKYLQLERRSWHFPLQKEATNIYSIIFIILKLLNIDYKAQCWFQKKATNH